MSAPPIRANVGCGRDVLPGWVNADRNQHEGVDVLLDMDRAPWPFESDTVDYVLASQVLEHVLDFGVSWREISRILRPGGIVEVRVPLGINYDPYHIRYFSRKSVGRLTGTNVGSCLDEPGPKFEKVWVRTVPAAHAQGFPWWHVEHHLGLRLPFCPWGRELWFALRKRSVP